MSTPLIAVAAILAVFALVLIPFMMMKGGEESHAQPQDHPNHQGRRFTKKKKKRK